MEQRYNDLQEMRGWGPEAQAEAEQQYRRSDWWNDANRDRTVSVIDY